MVSIVITSYNNEATIQRAIDSALSQSYNDIEVIVVDDCSTDSSTAICKQYGDKIKVISAVENRGLPHSRKVGISHASGEFISFLDADDCLDKNAIEHCVKCQEETNADIVQMRINRKITKLGITLPFKSKYDKAQALEACIYNEQLFPIQCCAKLYKTDLIRSITPINYDGFWGEDRILNLPIMASNPTIVVEKKAKYNYTFGGATTSAFNIGVLQEYKQIYQLKRDWAIQNGYNKYLPKIQAELIELLKYHIRHLINSKTMFENESMQYLSQELKNSFWEPFQIQSAVDMYVIEKKSFSRIAKKYITNLFA